MSSSNPSDDAQQPVIFTTKSPYPLPSQKYLIPTAWKRFHLSQLVNKALSLTTPVPFDFLVKGEILRSTLGEWCAEHGIVGEETLEIEYIESIMPPQKMSDFPHEDWVSSILCDVQGYLLTGSYDGHIRAFDYSKNLVADAPSHAAPITSIALISSPNDDTSTHTVASSSHDLTVAISQITLDSDPTASSPSLSSKVLTTLHLHTSPVSSVSSNSSGTHLLTSSWDGLIGLWDTTIPSSDEVPSLAETGRREKSKRRKVDDDSTPPRKAPINVLKSHTARVSKVIFNEAQNSNKAYSCGFDSTVRVWDTEIGVSVQTITASEKPFLSLAVSPDGRNALATSTDRTMMLYDLRSSNQPSSTTTLATSTISSFFHPATPSCIALSKNGNQVATGAYDGVVRVWDLRSTKSAMASFKAWPGDQVKKVLDVSWKRSIVGVAGEGGVEVWKVGEEAGQIL